RSCTQLPRRDCEYPGPGPNIRHPASGKNRALQGFNGHASTGVLTRATRESGIMDQPDTALRRRLIAVNGAQEETLSSETPGPSVACELNPISIIFSSPGRHVPSEAIQQSPPQGVR